MVSLKKSQRTQSRIRSCPQYSENKSPLPFPFLFYLKTAEKFWIFWHFWRNYPNRTITAPRISQPLPPVATLPSAYSDAEVAAQPKAFNGLAFRAASLSERPLLGAQEVTGFGPRISFLFQAASSALKVGFWGAHSGAPILGRPLWGAHSGAPILGHQSNPN